jgi:hypothetical protein
LTLSRKVHIARRVNKLPLEKRTQILNLLVEGSSLRSISRVCDVDQYRHEIAGRCRAGLRCFPRRKGAGVNARRVQVDEIWSFTYAKQKMAKRQDLAYGDTWTWTAIEADSKLNISWLVGERDGDYAIAFMDDLRSRLANRVQLTGDGHKAYLEAMEGASGSDIDYAALVKHYGPASDASKGRYTQQSAPASARRGLRAAPAPSTLARPLPSGTISTCGCRCAVSPD